MWAFSPLPLLGTHTARLSAPSPGRQDGRILAQTGADGSLWPGFRQLVQRLAFGWIGFRKAFWWVRDDLLYLTEPLFLLVGAGRFERPTPCAQGSLRHAAEMPYFQVLRFLIDGGFLLKRVEPC